MLTEKEFEELKERVRKLEEKIFVKKENLKLENFKGLVGGINFLIKNGFLDVPKSVEEIKNELDRESYYYPYTSIHKTMIDFVKKKILTRFREIDIWKYVIRK